MKKILVLASSHTQYMNFCRQYMLHPRENARFVKDDFDVIGFWIDQPVILLEDYQYNPNYDLRLMEFIGNRFENIGFLSDGERYNENLNI